jgi:hypothetical protein
MLRCVASALSGTEAGCLGGGSWKTVKCPYGAAVCCMLCQIGSFSFMSLFLNNHVHERLQYNNFQQCSVALFCGECNRNKLFLYIRAHCVQSGWHVPMVDCMV